MNDYSINHLILNNFHSIPQEILQSHQLCLWKFGYVNKQEKQTKIPYGMDIFNFIQPNLKNPNCWLNIKQLYSLDAKEQKKFGLGIVLNNTEYICIDLDNVDTNNINREIQDILILFKSTYIELSPSGSGLHIFSKGSWPYNLSKSRKNVCNNTTIEV